MFKPLAGCKGVPYSKEIKKIKMKRGCALKEESKGKKIRWSREKMKEMNLKSNGPGKCASPNATTILFLYNNGCVQLFFMPQSMVTK